ncbi:hypothetical protein ACHMW7_05845 [Aminobacter sp. UC22_36]|uniref:hypothetical protein n=1 Tax=Aminobacter sp. UC22_36 TaxID=3374549 RepID=UPI003756838F
MAKCIYREVVLDSSNNPEDGDASSVEHIIPWALGGSNAFTTNDASKFANNSLGSEVDARFANTLPIAIMRHRLQLKSQSGSIAPIVWHGESPEGFGGTVTIHHDGKVDTVLDSTVNRPQKGQPGPISIAGPRERIEGILDGMLSGMNKRKEVAYSEDGNLLSSLDDFFAISKKSLVDKLSLSVEYFNQEAWTRGILKIALASCHKILGSEWTFSADASGIRQAVMNPRKDWTTLPRGFIAGELDRRLRLAMGKTAKMRDTFQHIVTVLPSDKYGRGIVVVSLFGGNGVPESLIDIGQLPPSFCEALNRENNGDTIVGYRVDPKTRVTVPITFREVDRRMATQGPSDKKSLQIYRDPTLR